jgi:hypothetical protein
MKENKLELSKSEIKEKVNEIFEDFLEFKFTGHLGKVVNITDADMLNVIENAFSIEPYDSIDETLRVLKSRPDLKGVDIRHKENGQWIIENQETLDKITKALSNKRELAEAA